jgi:CRP-like cAMP-binding protein
MPEKHWFLKSCVLLARLAPAELSQLESRARLRKYPSHSPIYLPADQADAVLFLASGRVKIGSLTLDGKESILAFIEPGELFGELAIFAPGRREEIAQTIEPSVVVMFPREVFWELMQRHPDLSLGITKLIGLRRQRIERRIKYLLFQSSRDRLIHLLLELADQYGQITPQGVLLKIKLSHQDLANIIGSTRETVTVLLGELQAERHLELGRQKIILRDLRALAASAHAEVPARWLGRTEKLSGGNHAPRVHCRRTQTDPM